VTEGLERHGGRLQAEPGASAVGLCLHPVGQEACEWTSLLKQTKAGR